MSSMRLTAAAEVRTRESSCQRKNLVKNLDCVLHGLLEDESGQDLIEYALVASIIALGAIAAMTTFATTLRNVFTSIGTKMTSAI